MCHWQSRRIRIFRVNFIFKVYPQLLTIALFFTGAGEGLVRKWVRVWDLFTGNGAVYLEELSATDKKTLFCLDKFQVCGLSASITEKKLEDTAVLLSLLQVKFC